jgi:hypothetical protein
MLAGIAAVSAALLMTELALTRIFSVTMYYHFAFLAISIALFGLSASGVTVFVLRRRLAGIGTRELLTALALLHALVTVVALAFLVRIRVGLNYSPENVVLMLAIYVLSALPFFTGGAIVSLGFARRRRPRGDRRHLLCPAAVALTSRGGRGATARLSRGRPGRRRGAFRCLGHEGPPGRSRAVQQVEFVLASGGL